MLNTIHFPRIYVIYLGLFYAFFMFFSPLVLNSKLIILVFTQLVILAGAVVFYKTIDYSMVTLFALLVADLIIQLLISVFSNGIDVPLWMRMIKAFVFYVFVIISVLVNLIYFRQHSINRNFRLHRFIVSMLNLVAVYCIAEYFFKYNPLFGRFFSGAYHQYYSVRHADFFYRVSGTMQHPIVMGSFLLVNVILNFGLYARDKKIWPLLFPLINLAALFLTFSRGSYLALAVAALFYFLINITARHRLPVYLSRAYLVKIAAVLAAIAALLFAAYLKGFNVIGTIASRFLQLGTGAGGISLYQRLNGFHFVMNSMFHKASFFQLLFGNGVGSLAFTLKTNSISLYAPGLYVVDNQYLTLFYEFGLVGICFFPYIIIRLFLFCLKTIAAAGETSVDLEIFLTAFLGLFINLAFYDGFYWSNVLVLLGYLAAWILYLSHFSLPSSAKIYPKLSLLFHFRRA